MKSSSDHYRPIRNQAHLLASALLVITFILGVTTKGSAQLTFHSIDSLFAYAGAHSVQIRTGALRLEEAQRARLFAVWQMIDPTGSVSFNVTNNTRLPVNYFPAEAFGGTPGTYQAIRTGTKYTNNGNQYLELKLLNPQGWKSTALAKTQIALAGNNQVLDRKTLYESIAATYYSLLSLDAQLSTNLENEKAADTLAQIVKDKYEAGFARPQEVNSARVNLLNIQETGRQIGYLKVQQLMALKILCDIPDTVAIDIVQPVNMELRPTLPSALPGGPEVLNADLREYSALLSYQQQKLSLLPTLSAFGSNSNQQFSDSFSLFSSETSWINSNYIGLKATWQLPSAQAVSKISTARYDYLVAREQNRHTLLETNLDQQELTLKVRQAQSQLISDKAIFELQNDTYLKNLDNYRAGFLELDQLLNSYTARVSSQYTYISSGVELQLALKNLQINNEVR